MSVLTGKTYVDQLIIPVLLYKPPGKKSPHIKKLKRKKWNTKMNRASFRTKSMSLNVSGKHNNKCKSMYTEYSFSLSLTLPFSRIACFSSEQPYFLRKKKVQWKVHFVESMVFFFRMVMNVSVYSAFMLLQYHTHTHTNKFLFLRMQKRKTKEPHATLKFQNQQPSQIILRIIIFLGCCVFYVLFFKFSYSVLVWFRFGSPFSCV